MAEVIWTEPALDELDAIARYVALDKPGAASRLVERVFDRVEQLARFPESGGKPRELSRTPYRQLIIPPLRVFYRIEDNRAFIVYVMRGERRFRLSDISVE